MPAEQKIELYGLLWSALSNPLWREMRMIQNGGRWKTKKTGRIVGNGLFFHYKEAIRILWPEFKQHRWFDLLLKEWLAHKYIGVLGPKNCIAGDTRIFNPITLDNPTVRELCENQVAPVVQTLGGPMLAGVPFLKGKDALYKITLANGNSFRATAGHQVLTGRGYVPVRDLNPGSFVLGYGVIRQASIGECCLSTPLGDDLHCTGKVQDSQFDYPACPCSCDEQPLPSGVACQGDVPSQVGVPKCDLETPSEPQDGRGNKPSRTRLYQQSCPPSSWRPLGLSDAAGMDEALRDYAETHEYVSDWFQQSLQSHQEIFPRSPFEESGQETICKLRSFFSCDSIRVQQTAVVSKTFVGIEDFYDLHVPIFNHYFAEGAIHHNSGKTSGSAVIHLMDWYCFSSHTTVLLCSTTKEMLENRIWGEVKRWHRLAKERYMWLPGSLIEGRQRIVADDRDMASEGRDFRNGIMGIPLKKGGSYVGISDIIGIKNKRKRLCGDELQCLPKSFIDATANFIDQSDCRVTGMGNPAQTTDALGILCEPAAHLGGWDGGIDQTPKTKVWETRFSNGVCIQFPGSDSPNSDVPANEPPPFPFLMTRQQMEADAATWGKEDWHYTMFNEGRMPRGQGSRRIITRQLCLRHGAMEEAVWSTAYRTVITSLDAAYRAVGGDRCVYTEVEFGEEAKSVEDLGEQLVSSIINQSDPGKPRQQIVSLIRQVVIPIEASDMKSPEDQIVNFVKGQHALRNIPPENHFFDAGMRTSLVSAYARLWSPKVNTIDFGGKPTERKVSANIDVSCRDYYSKFVTELWYSVRLIIEAGQFRGMTEDLMLEGCQREWKAISGNRIEVETKEEMKEKTGRSPDLFDSLVCAIEGCRQRGFIIRRLDNPKAQKTDWAWKRELQQKAQKLWRSKELIRAA